MRRRLGMWIRDVPLVAICALALPSAAGASSVSMPFVAHQGGRRQRCIRAEAAGAPLARGVERYATSRSF